MLPRQLRRALAALLTVGVLPAAAQDPGATDTARLPLPPFRLVGTVRDTLDRPLANAEVRAAGRVAYTDALGRFRLDSLADDPTFVIIRRIGYQLAETEISRQADVLEIRIGVRLESSGVQLGTVVINGKTLDAGLFKGGFYQRVQGGQGTYFDAEKLKGTGSTYVSLLGAVSGVDFRFGSFGAIIAMGRTTTAMGRADCPMDVFLDGTHIRWATETGINGVIAKDELLAVEIYPRATDVPPTFKRPISGIECGAIVLWSKPYEPAPRR